MTRIPRHALAITALALVAGTAAAAKPVYQIEAIPFQGKLQPQEATGINSAGVVVGNAKLKSSVVCFTYQAGVVSQLPDSVGATCSGINNAGDVIGTVRIGVARYAAVWPASGGRQLLTDRDNSGAISINNNSQAVGWSFAGPVTHAMLYTAEGAKDLGTLGGESAQANGLNDGGTVVGGYRVGSDEYHAFAWENGVSREVCLRAGSSQASAKAVNSPGQILCQATQSDDAYVIFVQSSDGSQVVVPGLRSRSLGLGLNDLGHSVGIDRAAPTAAYFSTGTQTWDLLKLGDVGSRAAWQSLKQANAVNDQDQVVGWGVDSSGVKRAFVARPVATQRVR